MRTTTPYEPAPLFDWREWKGDSPLGSPEAYVFFEHYGAGSERTNSFQVFMTCDDVEALIGVFAKMKHEPAVRLKLSRELATAVESLTKNSN